MAGSISSRGCLPSPCLRSRLHIPATNLRGRIWLLPSDSVGVSRSRAAAGQLSNCRHSRIICLRAPAGSLTCYGTENPGMGSQVETEEPWSSSYMARLFKMTRAARTDEIQSDAALTTAWQYLRHRGSMGMATDPLFAGAGGFSIDGRSPAARNLHHSRLCCMDGLTISARGRFTPALGFRKRKSKRLFLCFAERLNTPG